MTRIENRSERWELENGATDGRYRKVRPDTTVVQPQMGHSLMMAERQALHPWWGYDYITAEAPTVVNPTGRVL